MLNKEKRGADLMILDTPGSFEDGVLQSINLSDLCLLVTRPNFLDIASLLTTAEAVRRLGRPALVVLNQAPSRRNGMELPVVNRAVEALRFTGLPIASVGLRARAAFQVSMQRGLAVFEWEPNGSAAEEARRLWTDVEARLLGPASRNRRCGPDHGRRHRVSPGLHASPRLPQTPNFTVIPAGSPQKRAGEPGPSRRSRSSVGITGASTNFRKGKLVHVPSSSPNVARPPQCWLFSPLPAAKWRLCLGSWS